MKIRPVILSGGSGTRLWPISRRMLPKQFVPLMGKESLFSKTLTSVSDRNLFLPPLIVGSLDHKFLILDTLEQLKIKDAILLLEPLGRNTAAAAMAAAQTELLNEGDCLHLVRPSDAVILDFDTFLKSVVQATPVAKAGSFVLFGVTPTHPETGYGYILPGKSLANSDVLNIRSFKEKPNSALAQTLITEGGLWNSGIFLYHPKTLLEEAQVLAPALADGCHLALQNAIVEPTFRLLDVTAYKELPNEPFDRVFMEKTKRGAVVPCNMGWSDVGSWQALWQIAKKDEQGNSSEGPVILKNSTNCYARSEGPAIALLGTEDLSVVATKDAVLITPRAHAQDVKELVTLVEQMALPIANDPTIARRPWGTYETVAKGTNFQVKHIIVTPGRSLSLQMHRHRAEHWVVVSGTAKVECDETEKLVFPNQSVFVPIGSKHRLSNPGKIDLHLIEVASGDYLGEDDIIRFEDNYGRVDLVTDVRQFKKKT